MRQDGGRPSPGMRPRALGTNGGVIAEALTVLIVPKEPAESTAFFRFQAQKSADPMVVYDRGLAFLQAEHFQRPASFSDRLTALLPASSPIAASASRRGRLLPGVRSVPAILPAAVRGLRA